MKYNNIKQAIFLKRLNRFVALCLLDGEETLCHVKNTGRCRELLIEGAVCYLEKSSNPNRKYIYSLISVVKGNRLINMDSQAPNTAAFEWLKGGGLFDDITTLKREVSFGKSRFDIYFEHGGKKAFLEVKGVTLENDGVVLFPDAPTERGVKHLNELCNCVDAGFEAYALFVVQMKGVSHFSPNFKTDPEFAKALKNTNDKGVKILCYDCNVSENEITICDGVSIVL